MDNVRRIEAQQVRQTGVTVGRKTESPEDKPRPQTEENGRIDGLTILLVTNIVVGVCQGCLFIYVSLFPYLTQSYGLDPVTFGYLQTAAGLLQLLVGPFIGRYGDRFGARAVLILSATCSMMGHMILGLANCVPWLAFSRLLFIGQDIRLGSQMMVSEVMSGCSRGASMARLALPLSLGMLVGPALSGQLTRLIGSQRTLLVTSLAPAACIVAMCVWIPAKTRAECRSEETSQQPASRQSVMSVIKDKTILLLMLTKLLSALPFMTLAQNLPLIGMREFQLTPQMNGLVLSYNGAIGVVINVFVVGRLCQKYTEDQLLRLAPWIMITAYTLLSQSGSLWMLLAVLIPWNLGNAILESQILSRLSEEAPSDKIGSVMGLNASIFQLARTIAPLLGGYFVQKLGFQAIGLFGLLTSICLCALIINIPIKKGKAE